MIPGMGGMEMLVIAILALVVVGPKDLPVLLRRLGKLTGKVRSMAAEFRASFDEMARQSELDELRKEVEALRNQQAQPLGPEIENHFREIGADLNALPTASIKPIDPELPNETAEAAASPVTETEPEQKAEPVPETPPQTPAEPHA
ncbi:MAG TPA: Sec-independent protein translocase protein TatB [Caulobacteraceae bacterium]|jgi:sec-independent protein translocase protein TatB|nr:Sec-independent protein translocase protein TatB [Caulobacteraceae bacterium]